MKGNQMKKYIIAAIVALCLVAAFLAFYYFSQPKSDYIGESFFPHGDSIQITSVSRTRKQLVVKGHYNLVSADKASLDLYITTEKDVLTPTDSRQLMKISQGQGDFELVHPDLDLNPGWPHVTMYSTNGQGIAGIYFGTKKEATEERERDIGGYNSSKP